MVKLFHYGDFFANEKEGVLGFLLTLVREALYRQVWCTKARTGRKAAERSRSMAEDVGLSSLSKACFGERFDSLLQFRSISDTAEKKQRKMII